MKKINGPHTSLKLFFYGKISTVIPSIPLKDLLESQNIQKRNIVNNFSYILFESIFKASEAVEGHLNS